MTQCDGSYDEYGQHAWKLPVAPGEVREGFTEDGRLERNLKTSPNQAKPDQTTKQTKPDKDG